MAGVKYDYCQDIPPLISHATFRKSWGEALGGAAGTICAAARKVNNGPFFSGKKQCNGHQTPTLTWAPLTFKTDNLPDDFSFSMDFWVGFEENAQGMTCLWFGIDSGPYTEIYARTPECYAAEVPYEAIVSLVEDVLNQLQDAVDKDTVIDTILKAVFVLAVLVLTAVVAYALGVLAGIVVLGGALLSGGGAIVG